MGRVRGVDVFVPEPVELADARPQDELDVQHGASAHVDLVAADQAVLLQQLQAVQGQDLVLGRRRGRVLELAGVAVESRQGHEDLDVVVVPMRPHLRIHGQLVQVLLALLLAKLVAQREHGRIQAANLDHVPKQRGQAVGRHGQLARLVFDDEETVEGGAVINEPPGCPIRARGWGGGGLDRPDMFGSSFLDRQNGVADRIHAEQLLCVRPGRFCAQGARKVSHRPGLKRSPGCTRAGVSVTGVTARASHPRREATVVGASDWYGCLLKAGLG